MKLFNLFLLLSFFQLCSCQNQTNDGKLSNFKIINAFPGISFTRPVDFQFAPDGSNRIYIVEQHGVVYSFDNNRKVKEKSLFLDIRDRVNDSGNEEGLLGLAFHPDFASNGYFFVDYTAAEPRRTVIARYSTDRQNSLSSTGEIILQIPQPFSNHNGGQLAFGEDGYLYIALGDGGSAGDPDNNGQNLRTLLGSILRIDVNQALSGRKYSIPPDNPFAGNTQGYCEEIFAYGLRNPWRFSFDSITKLIWTGDVGQNKYEEIDIIVKGGNYGWNIREGFHPFQEGALPDSVKLIDPVFEYDHSVGQSITGGFVYRGSKLPSLQGKYIYADFVQGKIWALSYQDKARVSNQLLLDTMLNIASFGIDQSGELYLCAFDGGIYTLVNESRP